MLQFLKQKDKKTEQKQPKQSWRERLSQGLKKTRSSLGTGISSLFLGKKTIDTTLLSALETVLLQADVGIDTTTYLLDQLTKEVARKECNDADALLNTLKQLLVDCLKPAESPLHIETPNNAPFTLLMVGVNGAGKSTSIAKIAHWFQSQGKEIMLAAGDTFRAAAIGQLQTWGDRLNIPVISQDPGADSASVIFDAMSSAQAKQVDLLIADTAGRLHTQHNLMEELKKVRRVMSKQNPDAPHEVMLILDASQGQNALRQALQFHEAIGLDSISITKLDGSAKGGILFAAAQQLNLPIRFIGVGESLEDLKPFDAESFVSALWDADS